MKKKKFLKPLLNLVFFEFFEEKNINCTKDTFKKLSLMYNNLKKIMENDKYLDYELYKVSLQFCTAPGRTPKLSDMKNEFSNLKEISYRHYTKRLVAYLRKCKQRPSYFDHHFYNNLNFSGFLYTKYSKKQNMTLKDIHKVKPEDLYAEECHIYLIIVIINVFDTAKCIFDSIRKRKTTIDIDYCENNEEIMEELKNTEVTIENFESFEEIFHHDYTPEIENSVDPFQYIKDILEKADDNRSELNDELSETENQIEDTDEL